MLYGSIQKEKLWVEKTIRARKIKCIVVEKSSKAVTNWSLISRQGLVRPRPKHSSSADDKAKKRNR